MTGHLQNGNTRHWPRDSTRIVFSGKTGAVHAENRGRFALTDKPDGDHWPVLGIEPISYPQDSDDDHSRLNEGIRGLADYVRRGLLGWRHEITEIARRPPSLDGRDAGIVDRAAPDWCRARLIRSAAMTVHLVRHGETPFNAARILQHPDTPLSERGVMQAERVARRLAGCGLAAILTSDYARARATAEAIHAATGAPIEVEPLLRERNFGIHRGCAYGALEADIFAPGYAPPGGESVPVFESRVGDAWAAVRAVAARARGSFAVVSHGLVCRTLVRDHLEAADGIDAAAARWVNACVTEIEAVPGPRWRITRLACAAHLDGLESLAPASMRSE